MPPDASTPITVGLFWIATIGFFASGTFLIWLFRQMKGLKAEILELVTKETEGTSKAIIELGVRIANVDDKASLVNERLHAIELTAAKAMAESAEKFMSKASAGLAIERVEKAVAEMSRDVGGRLNSIERHLRGALSPREE